MKKFISIVLALGMILSLVACGSSTPKAPEATTPVATEAETPATPVENEGEWWKNYAWEEDFHLTFATTAKEGSGSGIATARAIELIKERSNGKLVIEQVFNGALGNEFSCFSQCMEGSIDMTGASVGTVSTYVPHLEVFTLPFLINSYEQEWAVMQSDEWKAIRERTNNEIEGITIVSMTEFGMRHFATIDKPIKTIDDIKGLNIRSAGNPVIDRALTLLGANPVNVAYNDVYSALQNGLVDGEEINATSVSMQKHYEVINYISEIGFYPYLSFAVISDSTLAMMPEEYGRLIMETFAETDQYYMTEVIYDWDSTCRQDCLDNNVEFNTIEDKPTWVETMKPIYDDKAAEDPMYKAFIEKALSLQK